MKLNELFDKLYDISPFLIIGGICTIILSGMIAILSYILVYPLWLLCWAGVLILLIGIAIVVIEDFI